jgi:4-hydroxythreonine-4-phosphate dehydrogenase
VGPEVSVRAAARFRDQPCVLVGDFGTIIAAARLTGVSERALTIFDPGPKLAPRDRRPGRPSKLAGAAQLAWIEAAYELAKKHRGALVTGPVSKAAIARSGAPGAARFRGHTEWLLERDRARHAVMCFAARELVTSLVTTHLPLARVPAGVDAAGVCASTLALAELCAALGKKRPKLAVASLNPHAGESELLGREEARAIVPGIERARKKLGRLARIEGPIGAETAYRKALAGVYDGVVAMYHDQATIPTKLVAFGDAVNVTIGLSIVRTSVDHGTGYDIAWSGRADASGMLAALALAAKLKKRVERARRR